MHAFAGSDTNVIPEVNAKVKLQRLKKSDGNMQTTHLSQQQLNNAPPLNLTTVLNQEQSIVRMVKTSGDSGQTVFSIRGFGDNAAANSLILVDGFPLTNPSLLAPNVNAITLENIERIDIYQGSQGTLWGDQAVGGVVSINTRHPERFMANANAGIGSFNQQYISALLGNKLKNGILVKSFYVTEHSNNYRQHNNQQLQSGLAQIGYDYAKGSVGFNLRSYNGTTFFPGGLTQTQYDDNPRQASNFTNFSRYQTNIYQFFSKHALNSNWLLETRLGNKAINGDGYVNNHFNVNEWDVLINPRLIGNISSHKLIVGYAGNFSHYHMTSHVVNNTADEKQHNFYAELTAPISSELDFIVGGRDAWQSAAIQKSSNPTTHPFDRVFVSEQGLVYRPNTAWQFYLRRDGNFTFPKANEQTWLYQGTTSLQPQTGVSYETGATWLTEKLRSQLSLYQLKLHDEIAFNPAETSTNPFGAYQNYALTHRNGVTLTETYQVTQQTQFNTQINYVDARFDGGTYAGDQIPSVPAINSNIGLTHDWSEHWQTKYNVLYTGSRYASEDNANVGKQLPGYWINNVAMQYKLYSVIASFEIDNLFNQSFSTYTVYDVDSGKTLITPGLVEAFY